MILSKSLSIAKQNNLEALAFSFDPHPRKFFTQGRQPKLLMTSEEKIEFIEKIGFKKILIQNFSDEFSQIDAQDFISEVLIKHLKTKFLVVGSEFRFGFQAKGRLSDLKASKEFEVLEQDEVISDQQKISSSWIRRLVELGEVREANQSLGHHYFISGKIVSGDGIGRAKLGVPTINFESERECLPAHGVYLTMAQDLKTGLFFPSVANLGIRPSVGGKELRIEAHLIGVEDDFSSREMRLFFIDRLRGEEKFNSLDELKNQIQIDIAAAYQRFLAMKLLRTETSAMKWSLASAPDAAQSFQDLKIPVI